MEDTETRREFFSIPGLRDHKVNRDGVVIGPRGIMKPTRDNIHAVHKGKRKHHKGWRLA